MSSESGLSSASLRAAGITETTSWRLVIPAAVAVAISSAAFSIALFGNEQMQMWGGAAGGHKGPAGPTFMFIFAILAAGAALGGLLSRARVGSLLGFNAASALVAGLGIGIAAAVHAWPALRAGQEFSMVSGVGFYAFNFAFPFFVLQAGAALVGRLIQRIGLSRVTATEPGPTR